MDSDPGKTPHGALVLLLGGGLIFTVLVTAALTTTEAYYRFGPECHRSAWAYDRNLGWTLLPGQVAEVGYPWSNQPIRLRINDDGFRDRDHSLEKPEGVRRVMVLGDSYTAALEVPEDDIFTARLADGFATPARGGLLVEVMNVGVGAWSTDQQLIQLRDRGLAYDPDVVVLMIAPNDVREAYAKGFFTVRDGVLEQQRRPSVPVLKRAAWWLSNHSCAFQAFQSRIGAVHGTPQEIFRHFPMFFPVGEEWSTDHHLFLRDPPQEIESAYELFDALVLEVADLCESAQCELVLATVPTKMEFDGTLDSLRHEPGRVAEHVEELGRAHGIAHLNLHERLAERAVEPLEMFIEEEYHFTERGHAFVAEELKTFLEAM